MLAIFTLSLTAPANKEHTQGSLVTDDYTPVPIDSEAEALMGIGQCAVWCAGNVASWNTKCGWGSGYCSACSECSDVSVPHCVYWCAMHSASWGEKCAPAPPLRTHPRFAWGLSLATSRRLLPEMMSNRQDFRSPDGHSHLGI